MIARRLGAIWLRVLLLAGLGAASMPAIAGAGEYRAFGCVLPSGETAGVPVEWEGFGWYGFATQCLTGEGLYSRLGSEPGVGGNLDIGSSATTELLAPPNLSFTGARLTRTVVFAPPAAAETGSLVWQLVAGQPSSGGAVIEECRSPGCPGKARGEVAWSGAAVDRLKWRIACEGATGSDRCAQAASGLSRIESWVERVELTVRDQHPPGAGTPAVSAQGGANHVVSVDATDVGGGVFDVVARLGTETVGRWQTDACADRGWAAGVRSFSALVPCPVAARASVSFSTSGFAPGRYPLALQVSDAAGNVTVIQAGEITVADSSPPVPAGAIVLDRRSTRAVPRGAEVSLGGVLKAPPGAPISGARIAVEERLDMPGSAWSAAGAATTNAAGRFAVKVPTGASRRVRFTYAYTGGTSVVEASTRVRARLAITPGSQQVRRFGRLQLSGRLAVDGLPRRGAYVDLQLRDRGGWRTIATVRTDQSGTWRWRYRLASGQRATYRFRARMRPAADVASAPTTSRTVTVRVR